MWKQNEGNKFVSGHKKLKGSIIQVGQSQTNCIETSQEIIRGNGTVRIFDKLGRRMHTMARRKQGIQLDTEKLHLFDDYATPRPLRGLDKADTAGVLTDYQWIIASHK